MSKEKPFILPEDKIPLKEKILYGSAEIYGGGNATLISLVMLAFFNKGLGIDIAVASIVVMLAKAWDAISDPIMGVISDNTRSRWGRRRPYIVVGGALTLLSMCLLFAPVANLPMLAKIAYITFAYMFYCTVSTISQVPYCSLSSEISKDHNERTDANTIKTIFSMVGAALCYLVPGRVLEGFVSGAYTLNQFWMIMTIGFGLLFAIPLMLSGIFSKERTPYDSSKRVKFDFKTYFLPLKNKTFFWHIIMYLSAFLCMDIIASLAAFYTIDVLRGVTLFGKPISMAYVVAPMMVMAGAMLPFVYKWIKTKGKAYAYRKCLPCYIIGGLVLAMLPTSAPGILIPICAIVMGIGLGGAQMLPWLIFPDTIDVAELKLGYRPTGNFSGIMTFVRKLSTALAIFLVGIVLKLAGQIPGTEGNQPIQPESVLIMIRVLMGLSIAVLISFGIFASKQYKLTDKKLVRIRYFLDHQRADTLSSLPQAELTERENLIKELADFEQRRTKRAK